MAVLVQQEFHNMKIQIEIDDNVVEKIFSKFLQPKYSVLPTVIQNITPTWGDEGMCEDCGNPGTWMHWSHNEHGKYQCKSCAEYEDRG